MKGARVAEIVRSADAAPQCHAHSHGLKAK